MYYRRKILLSLLQVFDNNLEKISLQKLLMLFTKLQTKPYYYFVPYKFGCYSFQANADLSTMVKYSQVTAEGNFWKKTDQTDYAAELKESDRRTLRVVKNLYAGKSKDELIRITYLKYPYFAVNSTIVHEVLNEDEYQTVIKARPQHNATILFTIGYEGVSLEEYLNKLILNGIKVLCDVRRNSLSMKYGFSKSQLQKACEGVEIIDKNTSTAGGYPQIAENRKACCSLEYDNQYKKYDWIEIDLKRNTSDFRPESYRLVKSFNIGNWIAY